MTQKGVADLSDSTPRRFDVDLFVVHPSLDPADISRALGLEGHFSQRVGDLRRTPKGTLLSGVYPDYRWRHCIRPSTTEKGISAELANFIEKLEPYKEFFANVRTAGRETSIVLNFLGDGYLADVIPSATLVRLANLGLDLGIEAFTEPQSLVAKAH